MTDAVNMQSAILQQQKKSMMDEQNFKMARQEGVDQARRQFATTQELWRPKAKAAWSSLRILLLIAVIVLVVFYNLLADEAWFWRISVLIVLVIMYTFGNFIHEYGAGVIGLIMGAKT